jgi:chloride channel protein, CIC family
MRGWKRWILATGNARLLLRAAEVGLLASVAAISLRYCAVHLPRIIWTGESNLVLAVAGSPVWLRLLVPTLGGLAAGLILRLTARRSHPAHGWDVLEAVVLHDGVLHLRPAIVKSLSSLVTVGSAGAVGREGPMVLLSASVASWAGRKFRVPTRQLRILVGCGVAAGIACAYNTPIGAALFTMEILFGTFALELLAPLVVASVVGTLASQAAFGNVVVFQLPALQLASLWETLLHAMLGILGGLVAALFLQALRVSSSLFARVRIPRPLAMAAAGLALGVAIIEYPEVVGNGRESIRQLFGGEWTASYSLTLLALRVALTSLAVGSGTVGGVFTPTLFVGAALGEAFGSTVHRLFPGFTGPPKAYALVGMAAVLAGTTHAPLTASLMVFEMTLDYSLMLPILLSATVAGLTARVLNRESVYSEALKRKRPVESTGDRASILLKLTARDVMRREQVLVPPDLPLTALVDRFLSARRNHLYVVDPAGRFVGTVSLQQVRRELRESTSPNAITAGDIVDTTFETVTPGEPLDEVLERFWDVEAERLPVVADDGSGALLGTVSRRDLLGVSSLAMLHRRAHGARFESGSNAPGDATLVELPADYIVEEVRAPAAFAGRTLSEMRLRESSGLTVLLVRRIRPEGEQMRFVPDGSTQFLADDRLVLLGTRGAVSALKTTAILESR